MPVSFHEMAILRIREVWTLRALTINSWSRDVTLHLRCYRRTSSDTIYDWDFTSPDAFGSG